MPGGFRPFVGINVAGLLASHSRMSRRHWFGIGDSADRTFSFALHSKVLGFSGPCPVEDLATD